MIIKLKRAFQLPHVLYCTYGCSCITLCKKKKKRIFKVVYRQVFYRRLMQRVLYYSTTSNWSVCKSMQTYNSHRTQCEPYAKYTHVLVNTRPVFFTILWSSQIIHRCQPRSFMFKRCWKGDCLLWPHRIARTKDVKKPETKSRRVLLGD